MSSRLMYDESDDELQLINDKKIIKSPIEFGGSFGNIILTIVLPVTVILAKIALKTVIKYFFFFNLIFKQS